MTDPDRPIYLAFSEDGMRLSFEPFEGGRRYDPQPMVPASEWVKVSNLTQPEEG